METSRLTPTVHEPAQTAVHRNSTDPHALWVVWSKVGRTDHPGREGVVEILLRDAPRLLRQHAHQRPFRRGRWSLARHQAIAATRAAAEHAHHGIGGRGRVRVARRARLPATRGRHRLRAQRPCAAPRRLCVRAVCHGALYAWPRTPVHTCTTDDVLKRLRADDVSLLSTDGHNSLCNNAGNKGAGQQ